jgi:para-aminobenzoate synthetase component 1
MSCSFEKTLNKFGSEKEPFFFVINFDKTKFDVIPLKDLDKHNVKINLEEKVNLNHKTLLDFEGISFQDYKQKFDQVIENIKAGNTYLFNLTSQTKIFNDLTLEEIYNLSHARCKVLYKDEFVCFTPEKFVEIENNNIYTFPMKGTIDANISDAKNKIINDKKELAEHTMVVDLLRNDLSIVASSVKVDDFRYCEKIQAGKKDLFQVSSKISGKLNENWKKNIGSILTSLMPAGSITGTPKKKTVELIKEIEKYDRGYFTGICGVFDGKTVKSFVLIRFIENQNGNLVYKSGGGITIDSDPQNEYQEMLDKVYIP